MVEKTDVQIHMGVSKGELFALFAGTGNEKIPDREGSLAKVWQTDLPDGKSVIRDKGH